MATTVPKRIGLPFTSRTVPLIVRGEAPPVRPSTEKSTPAVVAPSTTVTGTAEAGERCLVHPLSDKPVQVLQPILACDGGANEVLRGDGHETLGGCGTVAMPRHKVLHHGEEGGIVLVGRVAQQEVHHAEHQRALVVDERRVRSE